MKYVYISPPFIVHLVCNVQLTKVMIVLPSNKWVALTRAGWCVVCVVDYQWQAVSDELFFQGSEETSFTWGEASSKFSHVKFSQDSVHQKLLKLVHFFIELFRI